MSDTVTIARPYAKAIYEHALDQEQLGVWSQHLRQLTSVVLDSSCRQFISNPSTSAAQHSELLLSFDQAKTQLAPAIKNLIMTLAENKRLLVLPEIFVLFEALRAEHEKTLEVDVISFSDLSEKQQKDLASALTKRLKRQVHLKVTLDKSLIGGAVINAGDLVIDGSVRGKLNTLRTSLAA